MGSRKTFKQTPASETPQELPSWNGTQIDAPHWLRDLQAKGHLFDPDVAYFLHTGSVVTSAAKTAVTGKEHSALLQQGVIKQQNFDVRNPPPVDTGFERLHIDHRAALLRDGETAKLAALPSPPPDVPDHHVVAPDRIMQLDMKLRNNLLSLITARGRQRHYQELTMSGCALLLQFAVDAKSATSAYVQSPHIRRLKAQLEEVKKLRMTQISLTEFNEIRDSLEELNDQLDAVDRMTNTQLCDHYINLIYQLNSYAVRISLETNMTINKVPYGDVEQTLIAITQVLTALLISDECIAMEAEGDSAGRALQASRDPRKTPKPPGAQGLSLIHI